MTGLVAAALMGTAAGLPRAAAAGFPRAAAVGEPVYPDLQSVIPPEDLRITRPAAGVKEFDYEHIVYNASPGPLEVQPVNYNPTTGYADGEQLISAYDSSGNRSVVQRRMVPDQFYFHAAHGHFHFPLASFGLYAVKPDGSIGDAVAVSPKNGFCIGDSVRLDPNLPHSPANVEHSGGTCTDPNALRGISPGWGDLYNRDDPGQAIDITGLPNGTYWFHTTVDPINNFTEADESNNTTDIKVRIDGDTVTPVSPLMSQGSFVIDKSFLDSGVGQLRTPSFRTTYDDDLLVAFVSAQGPVGSSQTATVSGGGLAWTLARRTNTRRGTAEVWTAVANGPLTNAQITSSLSSPSWNHTLGVFAVNGASGIGATAGAAGATGAPSASLTTTRPGAWVMGVGDAPQHWIPRVPGIGQTIVYDGTGEQLGSTHWIQARTSPSPSAGTQVGLDDIYPANDSWNFTAVELLPGRSQDTTPPTISSAAAANLMPDEATISWSTNEPATSQVEYGTTTAYGQSTSLDASLITSHAQVLTGLTPSTTYVTRLLSIDSAGNEAVKVGPTFTTRPPRTGPPLFSNVRVTSVLPEQVTVAWTTDEPADSQVEFGPTADYGSVTVRDPERLTSHFVLVKGLDPLTRYHFRVLGTDRYGNSGQSGDATFTTPGNPPPIDVDATVSDNGHGSLTSGPVTTVAADELLVAYVAADGDSAARQTATVSGGGLAWSLARRANGSSGTSEVWTAKAGAPLSGARVTSSLASADKDQSLAVVAYRGAEKVGAVASASAPTGAASVTFSTTRPGSMIYGVGNDWDGAQARTVGDGQSMVHQWVDSAVGDTFWVQRRSDVAGPVESVVTLNVTSPTTHQYNFVGVEIARPESIPFPGAPVIGDVRSTVLSSTSARVSWTTDRPATSRVDYGLTSSYGASASSATPVTAHSQTLTGLTPHTTYHFSVTSANDLGGDASADDTFATAFDPPIVDARAWRDGGTTVVTPTFDTTARGDLLVAFVSSDGPVGRGQTARVSGAGLTWTLVRRTNTRVGTSEVWTATAPGRLSQASVKSVAGIAGYDQSVTMVAFAGAAGTGADAGANGASGAPHVSLDTTRAGSLVFAVGNDWKSPSPRTLGAGQSMVHQWVDAGARSTFWVQRARSPQNQAPTRVTLNDVAPTGDPWNFSAVEILPR